MIPLPILVQRAAEGFTQLSHAVCYVVSTVCGIGFVPKMPGTVASVVALCVCVVPVPIRLAVIINGLVVLFVLGLACIPHVEREQGDDASIIVIDEVFGMWITIASPFVPHTWLWLCVALILFRYFDIIKPAWIGRLNARKGAVFVMADDALAGVFAGACLHIFYAGYLSMATLWYMIVLP
jgi:phosphatidylglycerophosphatase A